MASRSEYITAYKKENYKRVPLDLKKEQYQELKAAADCAGTSINAYIKTAIEEKILRDKGE